MIYMGTCCDLLDRYALIKSKYMHCFHLADKHGRLTYYERPGISEMRELKKMGVTREEMIEHYMYCMEYLWQVRYKDPKL